jgi:hypothetical protein
MRVVFRVNTSSNRTFAEGCTTYAITSANEAQLGAGIWNCTCIPVFIWPIHRRRKESRRITMKMELSIPLTLPICLVIGAAFSVHRPTDYKPSEQSTIVRISNPPTPTKTPVPPRLGTDALRATPIQPARNDQGTEQTDFAHLDRPSIEYFKDAADDNPSDLSEGGAPTFGDLNTLLGKVADWNYVFLEHVTETLAVMHRYSRPTLIKPCVFVYEERIMTSDKDQRQLAQFQQWRYTVNLARLSENFATAAKRDASPPIYELTLLSSNDALRAEQLLPAAKNFPPASQVRFFTAMGYEATSNLVAALQVERLRCTGD